MSEDKGVYERLTALEYQIETTKEEHERIFKELEDTTKLLSDYRDTIEKRLRELENRLTRTETLSKYLWPTLVISFTFIGYILGVRVPI